MLKNKYPLLFIVSAGILQIPAIFQAKEMGLMVAASDRNPNAPAMKYADIPLVIDVWDIKGHIKKAKELNKKYNLVGIYSQGADVETTVAETAKALGLPGTNPEAAWNCKNKARMRKVFQENNISRVDFAEVKTLKQAKEAIERIGLPVIVKNIDNSGSRGTTVVSKLSELENALEKAKSVSKTNTALIEKFLEGTEHSVDMIVFGGKYYPAGICDRPFSPPPFRVELGHINPTSLPQKIQKQIYKLTEKSGRILGINFGVAKADIILTKDGPVILEMTNRLSGGFDSQFTKPLALGINLIRPTIKMAIGANPDMEDLKAKYKKYSACLAVFPKAGVIKDIDGIEEALKLTNVTNVIITAKIGDKIKPAQSSAERVGFVISVANSRNKAIISAKKAIEKINIKTI